MESDESGFTLETTDPEQFQELLSPIVGPFRVRPARGSAFHARATPAPLEKLGLFTVAANSLRVDIEPPLDFFGINLPLGKTFSVTEDGQCRSFLHDVHLVAPDRPMALEAASGCRVLAVCLHGDGLREYAAKLKLSDRPLESGMRTRLAVSDPPRFSLVRSLASLWSGLRAGDNGPSRNIQLAETGDEVIANFVQAALGEIDDGGQTAAQATPQCTSIAEDYLCANLTSAISRADLAEISNVSIRTLSRGFMKRHGMGPMQFLKARRMDSVYRELLGAEPGVTTVTEVAGRYGFSHLGKFAVEYKQAFRESPSETLRH